MDNGDGLHNNILLLSLMCAVKIIKTENIVILYFITILRVKFTTFF